MIEKQFENRLQLFVLNFDIRKRHILVSKTSRQHYTFFNERIYFLSTLKDTEYLYHSYKLAHKVLKENELNLNDYTSLINAQIIFHTVVDVAQYCRAIILNIQNIAIKYTRHHLITLLYRAYLAHQVALDRVYTDTIISLTFAYVKVKQLYDIL